MQCFQELQGKNSKKSKCKYPKCFKKWWMFEGDSFQVRLQKEKPEGEIDI